MPLLQFYSLSKNVDIIIKCVIELCHFNGNIFHSSYCCSNCNNRDFFIDIDQTNG